MDQPTTRVRQLPDARDRHRKLLASERGLTLVEVLVVLLILGILLTMAIATIGNSGRISTAHAARQTAVTYNEAVQKFMRDHAGRPPKWGSPEWQSPTTGPVSVFQNGPKKNYLRTPPAEVKGSKPLITVGTKGTEGYGGITYAVTGMNYTITAWVDGSEEICRLGSGVPTEIAC